MASRWDCVYGAISGLSVGREPLRERLLQAWVYNLVLLDEHLAHGSEHSRKFLELKEELMSVEPKGDEGLFKAAIDAMTLDEVSDFTARTFDVVYAILEKEIRSEGV